MDGPEPSRFMCPVTLQEMNGAHAFVVLFSTGWVMADKAIKEVGIDSLQVKSVPSYIRVYPGYVRGQTRWVWDAFRGDDFLREARYCSTEAQGREGNVCRFHAMKCMRRVCS